MFSSLALNIISYQVKSMEQHIKYMKEALKQAKKAYALGEVPIGCVIVYEDKQKVECNSYASGPDFIVEIENIKSTSQLTVNCKGKDIEIDATHLINNDIEGILDDLQIETLMKEQIDEVLFSELPIKKKRINLRKLGNNGLEKKFVKLFLRIC